MYEGGTHEAEGAAWGEEKKEQQMNSWMDGWMHERPGEALIEFIDEWRARGGLEAEK